MSTQNPEAGESVRRVPQGEASISHSTRRGCGAGGRVVPLGQGQTVSLLFRTTVARELLKKDGMNELPW